MIAVRLIDSGGIEIGGAIYNETGNRLLGTVFDSYDEAESFLSTCERVGMEFDQIHDFDGKRLLAFWRDIVKRPDAQPA